MGVKDNVVDEQTRRGRRQLTAVLDDLRNARRAAGISQATVAAAVGCSRAEIGVAERGARVDIGLIRLVRIGAAVGLDLSVRTYPRGSALRDAGQLRLIGRFRLAVGPLWQWRTEVPVSPNPDDRRAFDAMLARGSTRVAVEAITRLTDAQAQIRAVTLKQQTAGVNCLVLVLADTRHNRQAVQDASAWLVASFEVAGRDVMRLLRAGEPPNANGYVLI